MKLIIGFILLGISSQIVLGDSRVKRDCCCDNNCNSPCSEPCNYRQNNNCNNRPCNNNRNNCQQNNSPCNNNNNVENEDTVPVLVPFPQPAQNQQVPPASPGVTTVNNTNLSNITAEISLTNTIHTVNNISVPISVNSTNENTISVYLTTRDEPDENDIEVVPTPEKKCCIVSSQQCDAYNNCVTKRHWECSGLCTGDIKNEEPPTIKPPIQPNRTVTCPRVYYPYPYPLPAPYPQPIPIYPIIEPWLPPGCPLVQNPPPIIIQPEYPPIQNPPQPIPQPGCPLVQDPSQGLIQPGCPQIQNPPQPIPEPDVRPRCPLIQNPPPIIIQPGCPQTQNPPQPILDPAVRPGCPLVQNPSQIIVQPGCPPVQNPSQPIIQPRCPFLPVQTPQLNQQQPQPQVYYINCSTPNGQLYLPSESVQWTSQAFGQSPPHDLNRSLILQALFRNQQLQFQQAQNLQQSAPSSLQQLLQQSVQVQSSPQIQPQYLQQRSGQVQTVPQYGLVQTLPQPNIARTWPQYGQTLPQYGQAQNLPQAGVIQMWPQYRQAQNLPQSGVLAWPQYGQAQSGAIQTPQYRQVLYYPQQSTGRSVRTLRNPGQLFFYPYQQIGQPGSSRYPSNQDPPESLTRQQFGISLEHDTDVNYINNDPPESLTRTPSLKHDTDVNYI